MAAAPPVPLAVGAEPAPPIAALSAPAPAETVPAQTGAVGLAAGQKPAATPVREPKGAAERERVARAGPRNAPPPAATVPRAAVHPAEPAAATPVVAPVPAPAPVPAQTVDQICADSSNFLSRDLCRVRACRNPAVAGDPVCVRFREMEAANRSRMDQ